MEPVLHIHDPFAPEPTARSRLPFPAYGPADLASLPHAEADWLVKGLLARGCVTELTADIRAGKTTFTAEMVRAMRERRPFLGQPTRWCRVTWLSEERPTTFLKAMRRAHLEEADVGEVCIVFRKDVANRPWPDLVKHCLADHGSEPGLLIVDTLSRFVGVGPDQENDPAVAARALEPLLQCAQAGLVVLVHRHARKGGGDVSTAARGSSAWSADADIMLLLRRPPRPDANGHDDGLATHTRNRILEAASRFTETPAQDEPETIQLGPDGYGLVDQSSARQQRYEDLDEQILLFVASHPGCSRKDVRETATLRAKATLRVDRIAELLSVNRLAEKPFERTDSRGRTFSVSGLTLGPNA